MISEKTFFKRINQIINIWNKFVKSMTYSNDFPKEKLYLKYEDYSVCVFFLEQNLLLNKSRGISNNTMSLAKYIEIRNIKK